MKQVPQDIDSEIAPKNIRFIKLRMLSMMFFASMLIAIFIVSFE